MRSRTMTWGRALFAVFFVLFFCGAACAPTTLRLPAAAAFPPKTLDKGEIRDRLIAGTVFVHARHFRPDDSGIIWRDGGATGVVVGRNGPLVLTAYHAVRDATDIDVSFLDGSGRPYSNGGQGMPMRVARFSEEKDVALLEPAQGSIWYDAAIPCAHAVPTLGDPVWYFGRTSTFTSGTVTDDAAVIAPRGRLIRADTTSRTGDSGAPLVNDRGELVGILILGNDRITLAYFVRIDDALAALKLESGD
jgi:hypothetical protein